MKKRTLILSFFTPLLFLTVGCNSDFLETSPTEFLTQEQLGEASQNNPDLLRGTVSGIYSLMFEVGTGGTTDHTDFGQKGVDIWTDMLSGDIALSQNTYNWYRNFVDYQSTVDFTRNENYIPWRYYYRIIRSTNIVITALGGNDAVPALAENRWLMGQAKALRAYSYFYLAQIYTRDYDASREILPIYTETTQQSLPKSTTAEVYDLIESDLQDAISLMSDFNRTAKNQVDQNVAKALLAYTYAAMGNNEDAYLLTEEIINSGVYPLTTATELLGGFNNINTSPSWMWGVDLTTDQGLDLISWWGQMDLYTYSYQWAGDRKSIDRTLFNAIPSDDVRKGQFDTQLRPVNKFYDPNRVIGGQRVVVTDYVYMRIDEIYLLNAETAAKTGRETEAQNRLIQLLTSRIPSTSYISSLTGNALQDEIYKQTRIELWGEGKSYLAMKRNQATINRGTNHLFQPGVAVPYNDPRLKFSIPQAEILYNPNINDQN
ncbi:RagB/SusD family nutrient uptake outer membrane protein [Flavobacterium cucumis]|uniref:SusD family protein n=1 Tax=Flavobacterium cucumis TaxID=416016 RepID=A0A1M7ZTD7_9FLAO|nr:RagB/SusD family nutrient uptake outer membrane protein [Flavobacterium cucumis]SHO71877.1 SusD family protein [Flavobacterium cucumis]